MKHVSFSVCCLMSALCCMWICNKSPLRQAESRRAATFRLSREDHHCPHHVEQVNAKLQAHGLLKWDGVLEHYELAFENRLVVEGKFNVY